MTRTAESLFASLTASDRSELCHLACREKLAGMSKRNEECGRIGDAEFDEVADDLSEIAKTLSFDALDGDYLDEREKEIADDEEAAKMFIGYALAEAATTVYVERLDGEIAAVKRKQTIAYNIS